MEESGGGKWWGVVAKPCDSCKVAAALVFCRVDSAFLCMGCDVAHTRHERVWMCEVCEQAPATVTCKADAAALCVTCDRDIHSANPLARRHERFPVVPFFDSAAASASSSATVLVPAAADEITDHHLHETTATTATVPSWMIPIGATAKVGGNEPEVKSIELLMSESDQFLDFDYPISINSSGTDSVVPVQVQPTKSLQIVNHSTDNNYLEIDFSSSKLNSFNNNNNIYTAQCFSQSVSTIKCFLTWMTNLIEFNSIIHSYFRFLHLNFTARSIQSSNCIYNSLVFWYFRCLRRPWTLELCPMGAPCQRYRILLGKSKWMWVVPFCRTMERSRDGTGKLEF
ncbi:Zinc finger protein CONSTANS-LIKE 5 [Camellia lanceoleosa]|uniref:Zinc finger protein CONSTANS-LIKE 5 n=1 Tax=Camellia lanceoleosa TaxID=1840588 RepID=A0ACC0HYF6_9ERIC|nr:Zinc finger protein CONSTANS-LIKE 5 [Camellia lanceoleosa]